MDEKRFVEILENNNEKLIGLIAEVDKKVDNLDGKLMTEMDKKLSKLDEKINKLDQKVDDNFEKLNQKIIDTGFYFEETYGEKITTLFDILQITDDQKKFDDEKFEKLERKVDLNSDKLAMYDYRLTALEKKVNSN